MKVAIITEWFIDMEDEDILYNGLPFASVEAAKAACERDNRDTYDDVKEMQDEPYQPLVWKDEGYESTTVDGGGTHILIRWMEVGV